MANTIPTAAKVSHSTPLHHAFICELLLAQDATGCVFLCRAIASAEAPDYGKIKVPALILAGEEDKSAPIEGCERIYESIGCSEKTYSLMACERHWHCVEDPDEVGKEIVRFYGQIQ
ncbi:MAG: hypothetical protein M1827_005322 [Pycnora praestabilis]|nr:MAG: hypothetical protein M1827_005322 [Pycnora praestabilis]